MRVAERSDADAIVTLINSAFLVERPFIDGDRIDLPQVLARFETGEFLVEDDGGSLIGCVYLEPRGDRAYLGLLSVDPARQRSGLGSRLMSGAEDRCREKGFAAIDLRIVSAREGLPQFYRERGYAETGTDPLPPEIPVKIPCHFINMSKLLA